MRYPQVESFTFLIDASSAIGLPVRLPKPTGSLAMRISREHLGFNLRISLDFLSGRANRELNGIDF